MKLYIKQRVFSLRDKYDIYDVNQNTIYYVESKLFSFLAKINLFNQKGQVEYSIKQNFKFFLSEYEIYKANELYATISQKMSFIKGKLDIDSRIGGFFCALVVAIDHCMHNNQSSGSNS